MDLPQETPEVVRLLSRGLTQIRQTPPRLISSPPTQPRRASVALLIRLRPPPSLPIPTPDSPPTLASFFSLPWVSHPHTRAELLFLPRADSLAFPGGRRHPSDEGALYTALRECWEQTGLDLADAREWACVGQLDDREVTTGLGKRLLMVLSPFVFLCLTPDGGQVDLRDDTASRAYWVPLQLLASTTPSTATVSVDLSTRLAPRSRLTRLFLRGLLGEMRFGAIVLSSSSTTIVRPTHASQSASLPFPQTPLEKDPPLPLPSKEAAAQTPDANEELHLWGLSLAITLDLVSHMRSTPSQSSIPAPPPVLGLSLTSIFPRFSVPDVNFWIWVFGRRYRRVIRGWEESYRMGGAHDRRINWSGTALSNFYASVRKALIMTVACRAVGLLLALWALGAWWFWWR